MSRISKPVLIGLVALLASGTAAFAQHYTVVRIEAPAGITDVTPINLNNRYQVIGHALNMGAPEFFIWDPANGYRRLPVPATFIDDLGVLYGIEGNGQPGYRQLPPPPGDRLVELLKVTTNGIVLARGEQTIWGLVGDTYYDVKAVTGAEIVTVNEQGVLGGCVGETPYLRLPDGRVVQPWPSGRCVTLLGPSGHFAAPQEHPGGDPNPSYYGTPDGRVWLLSSSAPPFFRFVAINASGTLLGWRHSDTLSDEAPFIYRDGVLQYLSDLLIAGTSNVLRIPYAINDLGAIVGVGDDGAVLLLPAATLAPAGLRSTVDVNIVTLEWDADPDIREFIVEAGTVPGATDFFNGSVGNTTAVVAAVPFGRYYVRVRGRTISGSLTGPSPEHVIEVAPPPVPAPPTEVFFFANSHISWALVWKASPGATDYILEVGSAPGLSDLFVGSLGDRNIQEFINPPYGRYYLRLRARNAAGVSEPSTELAVSIPF